MTDNSEVMDRLDEFEERLERLEEIFSPNLLDRQTRHVEARERDARDFISTGDIKEMKVISPVGDGQSPDQCVGKIHGIVTFLTDENADQYAEGDLNTVEVIDVAHSSAEAVPRPDAADEVTPLED